MAQGTYYQRFKLSRLFFWGRSFIAFIKSKWVHLLLFLVVNAVIGSLGAWMPILAAISHPGQDPYLELHKVLLACGPYTFAVAYLASSSSFVVSEYLESHVTGNRKLKVTLALLAFVLIMLCTLLSAGQTTPAALLSGPNASTSALIAEKGSVVTDRSRPIETHGELLNTSENVQVYLVILSILVGLLLHVLSRFDDSDVQLELAQIEEQQRQESEALKLRADCAGSSELYL